MIEQSDLIERWTNVGRVLESMPAHERTKHWNMETWGKQTDCGTIACAAGHCGLDPWFRERGFKLDFIRDEANISSVENFFGFEGSWKIFLDSTPRSVESVIDEVHAFVRDSAKEAELTALAPCRVGEVWPGEGGVYAGARLGLENQGDYFLIVGPEHQDDITWHEATSWAKEIQVDARSDFRLPFRVEQRALIDRVRSLFQMASYWSCEQHAGSSGYAWGQHFDDGLQDYWSKSLRLRARAVRSILIQ